MSRPQAITITVDGQVTRREPFRPLEREYLRKPNQPVARELATIKKSSNDWDTETYENEVKAWAGSLSETWERIISQEIAGQLVKPGTLEVQVRMMKSSVRLLRKTKPSFRHRTHAAQNGPPPRQPR